MIYSRILIEPMIYLEAKRRIPLGLWHDFDARHCASTAVGLYRAARCCPPRTDTFKPQRQSL